MLIRYADDALALCHSREQAEQVKARLAAWLAPRGLVFNEDKTRIVVCTRARERGRCVGRRLNRLCCWWKMKVVTLRVALRGEASNRPLRHWLEDSCSERVGKGAQDASGGDREGERKRIAVEVSKLVLEGIKTGASTRLQDKSGGDKVTGQVVKGM